MNYRTQLGTAGLLLNDFTRSNVQCSSQRDSQRRSRSATGILRLQGEALASVDPEERRNKLLHITSLLDSMVAAAPPQQDDEDDSWRGQGRGLDLVIKDTQTDEEFWADVTVANTMAETWADRQFADISGRLSQPPEVVHHDGHRNRHSADDIRCGNVL